MNNDQVKKPREFWVPYGNHHAIIGYESETEAQPRARYCKEVIHVREVTPQDLTPERVIESVIGWLRQGKCYCGDNYGSLCDVCQSLYVAREIESNKSQILEKARGGK